jgi:hypothetical protein
MLMMPRVEKQLHETIFPELSGLWGAINLNECVKSFLPIWDNNPLLDPREQESFVAEQHRRMNRDYSYGGYLEDRSVLWKDSYLPTDGMTHLGIDYNVPEGTRVFLPYLGRPVFRHLGGDQDGGWGGRLDFYSEQHYVPNSGFYYILGHLDPDSMQEHDKDTYYGKGVIYAGKIGSAKVNGGWYPHLHLQVVSKEEYESFDDPMKIDGYGGGDFLHSRYPDPARLL